MPLLDREMRLPCARVSMRVMRLIVAMCMLLAALVAAPLSRAQTPDATFELSAGTEEAGVGYGWASGMLYYRDESYPFRLDGLSVIDMDVPLEAGGVVYHLGSLADLDGTYAEVEVDPALAGAGFTAAIENEHGVLIGLRSATQGLLFQPSLIGVQIELVRTPQS